MRVITKLVPPIFRPAARSAYYSMLELIDRRPSRRNSLYAPKSLDFVTGGTVEFEADARRFLQRHIELGGLKPDHAVLDIGCGIGRLAAPLTGYLSSAGSYTGFDIVEIGIRWANHHIARQYPNFKFEQADVYSEMYNPNGRYKASEYIFPYEDKSFDYIFAASLFTHMLPVDMANYLKQIERVMKDDGRALITYFLLNQDSRRAIERGQSAIAFQPYSPECWTSSLSLPESALCYDESFVRQLHCKAGLSVERIHYGSWARQGGEGFQDVTVSGKCVV